MLADIQKRKARMEKRVQDVCLEITPEHTLKDVVGLSTRVMSSAVGNFAPHRFMMGSWVASQSMLTQLLKQPRLTVDLTMAELCKEYPLGLDIRSLVYLLENNLVLLNFRDYESEAKKNFSGLQNDTVQGNLEELFECVPHSIYFSSVIRKKIFDALLADEGVTYEIFYEKAQQALAPAHTCFSKLADLGMLAQDARFRGEPPSLEAVTWHWAFLCSIATRLPQEYAYVLNPTRTAGTAYDLYNITAQRGVDALRDSSHTQAAADNFAELSLLLRICHLNFTAPITASFGCTYNMTDSEYILSTQLLREPLQDEIIADEAYFTFLLDTLQNANTPTAEFYNQGGLLSEECVVKTLPAAAFTYDKVRLLTDVLIQNGDQVADAYKEITHLSESFLQDNIRQSSQNYQDELAECLDIFRSYHSKKNTLFRKNLEAGWKMAVLPLAEASFGVWAAHVGISPLESVYYWKALQAGATALLGTKEARIWKKANHSVLFRIHKKLTSVRA